LFFFRFHIIISKQKEKCKELDFQEEYSDFPNQMKKESYAFESIIRSASTADNPFIPGMQETQ